MAYRGGWPAGVAASGGGGQGARIKEAQKSIKNGSWRHKSLLHHYMSRAPNFLAIYITPLNIRIHYFDVLAVNSNVNVRSN